MNKNHQEIMKIKEKQFSVQKDELERLQEIEIQLGQEIQDKEQTILELENNINGV